MCYIFTVKKLLLYFAVSVLLRNCYCICAISLLLRKLLLYFCYISVVKKLLLYLCCICTVKKLLPYLCYICTVNWLYFCSCCICTVHKICLCACCISAVNCVSITAAVMWLPICRTSRWALGKNRDFSSSQSRQNQLSDPPSCWCLRLNTCGFTFTSTRSVQLMWRCLGTLSEFITSCWVIRKEVAVMYVMK